MAVHTDLRLSLRGFKSAFTRLGDTIEGFLAEGLHNQSREMAGEYSAKFKLQLEKLATATDKLCATNPSDLEDLYDSLDVENKKFIKLHSCLVEHIVHIEKINRENAAAYVTVPTQSPMDVIVTSAW